MSFSQEVNPNGYNKFFYLDGKIASEGNFKDGKPEGEWISYHNNGNLKSKGNKSNGLSVGKWNFYNKDGLVDWTYEYENDLKHGCAQRFDSLGNVIEEKFFVNGIVQGVHSWYYSSGELKKSVNVENGKNVGQLLEYNKEGDVITEEVYDGGFLKDRETYNRYDEKGEKTGVWREFYPDGTIKSEKSYKDGKLDGISKEFDTKGRLTTLDKMNYGKVDTAMGFTLLDMYKDFHDNGKKKLVGGLQDGLKNGIFREYDDQGNLVTGYIYEYDTIIAEGFISPEGIYTGLWKLYYKNGAVKAEGEYENGIQNGEWVYYYPSGQIEQKGLMKNGTYVGSWTWYYSNGTLKRTEYYNGKSLLEGTVTEYDSLGNEIARGDYYNGLREGEWFYHVNDYKEVGAYTIGFRDGIWRSYYENGKLYWEGAYSEGEPKGKHVYYHKNGMKKYKGKYQAGVKHGVWRRYDEKGQEIEAIIYKYGEIYKINGFKVKPVEESE